MEFKSFKDNVIVKLVTERKQEEEVSKSGIITSITKKELGYNIGRVISSNGKDIFEGMHIAFGKYDGLELSENIYSVPINQIKSLVNY